MRWISRFEAAFSRNDLSLRGTLANENFLLMRLANEGTLFLGGGSTNYEDR